MAPQNEREKEFERRQEKHEERVAEMLSSFSVRLDKVEEKSQEARNIAFETQVTMENMPLKVVEMIEARNKGFRMEWQSWALWLFAGATLLLTVGEKVGWWK